VYWNKRLIGKDLFNWNVSLFKIHFIYSFLFNWLPNPYWNYFDNYSHSMCYIVK